MDGAAWLFQWGGQLSSLAENLVEKVPDEEEWNVIRGFLQNVSSVFRRGDIRSGARAFYKVMPYVQRALASTEKVKLFILFKHLYGEKIAWQLIYGT